MLSSDELIDIFCYIQRALLDHITPNLRAVYVVIEDDETYELLFICDKEWSEDEGELYSIACTEFVSDYPDFNTKFKIEVIPYPNIILKQGFCVYKRYEKNRNVLPKRIGNIRYFIQQALLDKVTPNLRGVHFVVENEQSCKLLMSYDKELSEEEKELSAETAKHFSSFFSPPHQVTFQLKIVPYPEKMLPHPEQLEGKVFCVYHRFE